MLQNGKPVQSIWLGGERFDKYSQDDEDALAKHEKMQAFIGTQVYVHKTDNIKDLEISLESGPLISRILNITPQKDGYVSVVKIIWDGDSSVDLIGSVAVLYDVTNSTSDWNEKHTDLCIIDTESI